ncbi:ABC transporter permease [Paenibacillus thiaminolyticus]|uniref:ABC transporter permease n=1 Tax=Paenibacillus thiaminolyticus TaxID=49283 RepID=UPI003D2CED24
MQADVYKLTKSTAIKCILAITTVSAVIMTIIAYLVPQGKVEANLTGLGFMFSDVNLVSILGAVIAGLLICSDFDNKIIHDAIATGNGRGAIITSKAIVYGCALVIILLPYAIVTGIALSTGSTFNMGSIAVGYLNLLTSNGSTPYAASDIWRLASVLFTLMIVYVEQLSICVPLALLLKKPVLVVAVYYGFSILITQLARLSASYEVFDRIFSLTPYGGNYTMVTLNTGTDDMVKAIIVSFIFIIGMVAVAYGTFRKAEIK